MKRKMSGRVSYKISDRKGCEGDSEGDGGRLTGRGCGRQGRRGVQGE